MYTLLYGTFDKTMYINYHKIRNIKVIIDDYI